MLKSVCVIKVFVFTSSSCEQNSNVMTKPKLRQNYQFLKNSTIPKILVIEFEGFFTPILTVFDNNLQQLFHLSPISTGSNKDN